MGQVLPIDYIILLSIFTIWSVLLDVITLILSAALLIFWGFLYLMLKLLTQYPASNNNKKNKFSGIFVLVYVI